MLKPKKLLFIFRSSPYGSSTANEGLDALLAAAAFDQDISVLFLGDGVFQLVKGQAPSNRTNQEKKLGALSLYDVTNVYADKAALAERGLHPLKGAPESAEQLCIEALVIEQHKITELLANSDHILTF